MTARDSMSHEQAIELLPWLVNDTLDVRNRDVVREHAVSCVICRRELAELEALRDSIAQVAGQVSIPEPDMRRINARIDALIERETRGRRFISALRDFVGSPWRIAFAAQTVVLIALGAALLWPDPREPEFTTLTVPENLPDGHYVRVVFDPTLDTSDLASLLGEMQLTIVGGPSDRGVYTLSLAEMPSEADRDAVVSALLGHPGVLFAQPVTRGAER